MKISGNVDEIRFRNEENGYTIAVLDVGGDPVIVVGTFPPVSEGDDVEAKGDYVIHPKFGRQFKATEVKRLVPTTADGIVRFLGSGLIKGVGPRTALAIVSVFGASTLETIEKFPRRLTVVKGISPSKAEAIHEAYMENKKVQDTVMYLQAQDIALGTALKVYRFYGDDTIDVVSHNPYKLIEDIEGIGFVTADRIAMKQGMATDSPFRIKAGVFHELARAGEDGNTFLPKAELSDRTAKLIMCEPEKVDDEIDALLIEGKLKQVEIDGESAVFHRSVFQAERGASAGLIRLITESDKLGYDVEADIKEFERLNGVTLHENQKEAVRTAVKSGVCVITGGPGTGKTTVVKCIIDITEKLGITTLLMAPTGRAAKRMNESTGREAATIHRALMKDVGEGYKSAVSPLNCGAVIVDEVSMVDVFLLNLLVRRLASGTRLILVGDKDQLPSVGAGNVLADIIASNLVPVVMLTHIYRQSEKSLIAASAHDVNEGRMPDITSVDKDFFFVKVKNNIELLADTIVDMASKRIPKYLGVDALKLQVLCPVKNGACGTIELNKRLREVINPVGKEIRSGDVVYRVGDKVMHTANNYTLAWTRRVPYYETGEGVFNGDTGTITDVNTENGEISVLLDDGRSVVYPPDARIQLMPAYAVTVHKSQGSEYVGVIMPIMGGSPMIMTRNLLYTAITRAKKFVALVGDEYYLKRMVDNNYIAKRYSGMRTFLTEFYGDNNLLYGDI